MLYLTQPYTSNPLQYTRFQIANYRYNAVYYNTNCLLAVQHNELFVGLTQSSTFNTILKELFTTAAY